MMLLEQVAERPDWMSALAVAITPPAGVAERRSPEDDPWAPQPADRPRRISDDLVWLRDAMDEPAEHGLTPVGEPDDAVATWRAEPSSAERLVRLRNRGVLDAAGFFIPESD
jgi:hypothetical protein